MSTDTFVLCHKASESVEHIFFNCYFSERIWFFFKQILDLQASLTSIATLWTSWIPSLNSKIRILWDLISRALIWNIWLDRNNWIFNLSILNFNSIICETITCSFLGFLQLQTLFIIHQVKLCKGLSAISTL